MKISDLIEIGKHAIGLSRDYSRGNDREMALDGMIYGLLASKFDFKVSRQHHVRAYGASHPKRIDFRIGGSNPVVIEFAVRPPTGIGTLYGTQNTDELRKLCRVKQSQAKTRALLLLDLFHHPIDKLNLKPTYDSINAGPGKFIRHSVRIVYVHEALSYHFIWKPFR